MAVYSKITMAMKTMSTTEIKKQESGAYITKGGQNMRRQDELLRVSWTDEDK